MDGPGKGSIFIQDNFTNLASFVFFSVLGKLCEFTTGSYIRSYEAIVSLGVIFAQTSYFYNLSPNVVCTEGGGECDCGFLAADVVVSGGGNCVSGFYDSFACDVELEVSDFSNFLAEHYVYANHNVLADASYSGILTAGHLGNYYTFCSLFSIEVVYVTVNYGIAIAKAFGEGSAGILVTELSPDVLLNVKCFVFIFDMLLHRSSQR